MEIVFFGTSAFAAQVLKFLLQQVDVTIKAVVTRPDKPRGRLLHLSPPPVKEFLAELKKNIPIHQPIKASSPEFCEILKSYNADLFVVVAYGEILKQNILSLPPCRCINIHASLLPKYRGAAPMQRCLMNGEIETGITIIDMVLEMDAGDMLNQVKILIPQEMTYGELDQKLILPACEAVLHVIRQIKKGIITKTPQDASQVTFAQKIMPQEEEIFWEKPAETLHNQIRALSPTPGAWCWMQMGEERKKLKIKKSIVSSFAGTPGEILSQNKKWIIACGEKSLELLEVQLEGKKNMKAQDFLNGLHVQVKFF